MPGGYVVSEGPLLHCSVGSVVAFDQYKKSWKGVEGSMPGKLDLAASAKPPRQGTEANHGLTGGGGGNKRSPLRLWNEDLYDLTT